MATALAQSCMIPLFRYLLGRGIRFLLYFYDLASRSPSFWGKSSFFGKRYIKNVNHVNHSLLPSTITRILFCCRHNVSPSTAPSYVEDSNPGSLAPESGILPRGHGSSTPFIQSYHFLLIFCICEFNFALFQRFEAILF